MPDRLSFVQELDHGIHAIDTGFHRPVFDASYLITEHGRAAFVDTGTTIRFHVCSPRWPRPIWRRARSTS